MAQIGVSKFLTSAIVMFGLFAGVFLLIHAGLPSTISDSRFIEYNKTINKFDDVYRTSESIKNTIDGADPKSGTLGFINGLIQSAWAGLTLVWDTITTTGTVMFDLLNIIPLPIPSWFSYMVMGVIFIIVTFSLITLFFGRET